MKSSCCLWYLCVILFHSTEFISESEDSHRDKNVSGGEVMEPPFIEDLSPDNVQIVRGMDFQLKAKFVGEPTPTIKWFHDKTQLAQGTDLCNQIQMLYCINSLQPGRWGYYDRE